MTWQVSEQKGLRKAGRIERRDLAKAKQMDLSQVLLFRWHVDNPGARALSEIGALTHFPEMFIWFEEGVWMNRREGLHMGPGEKERKRERKDS